MPSGQIYADLALPSGSPTRPYAVMNTVATVDGATALGGRSHGIGSHIDRATMRRLRAAADATLVGAATLRAEQVTPGVPAELAAERSAAGLPAQPLAVTLTASLDLDAANPYFSLGPERSLVFAARGDGMAVSRAILDVARVQLLEGASVDLSEMLGLLRNEHGVRHLVLEGGASLARAFLRLGAIDEVFVTVAPAVAGAGGPGMFGVGESAVIAAGLSLVSVIEVENELFLRYRVQYRKK